MLLRRWMSKNSAEYESVLLIYIIAKVNRKKLRWISFLLYYKISFCAFLEVHKTYYNWFKRTQRVPQTGGNRTQNVPQGLKTRPSFCGSFCVLFLRIQNVYFHIQNAYKLKKGVPQFTNQKPNRHSLFHHFFIKWDSVSLCSFLIDSLVHS